MKLSDIWRSKFLATSTEAIGGGLRDMLRNSQKVNVLEYEKGRVYRAARERALVK